MNAHSVVGSLRICPGCGDLTWSVNYCDQCARREAEMEATYAERELVSTRMDSLFGSLPRVKIVAAVEDDSGMDGTVLVTALVCGAVGAAIWSIAITAARWALHLLFSHLF
ncbi:MAG TPA: hypothetical protein VM554_15180 [Acidisarcina sp.]|nr:hypothetical protein [Acidisarcina sp.]